MPPAKKKASSKTAESKEPSRETPELADARARAKAREQSDQVIRNAAVRRRRARVGR